MRICQRWIFAA